MSSQKNSPLSSFPLFLFVPPICLLPVLYCSHLFSCWTPSAATFLSTLLFLQPPFFCLCPSVATFLSHSFCSFKKRGWFLMATKDVTHGHERWWHLSSISCKNEQRKSDPCLNGGLQIPKYSLHIAIKAIRLSLEPKRDIGNKNLFTLIQLQWSSWVLND